MPQETITLQKERFKNGSDAEDVFLKELRRCLSRLEKERHCIDGGKVDEEFVQTFVTSLESLNKEK
ncbi:hypothetical protein HYU19_05220 [Candidatus Woesearchaeota archaeon]|nr:hypothetical protein [Candidatus Woesearchaeota archaeon]